MKIICLMIALNISFLAGAYATQTPSGEPVPDSGYRAALAETAKKYDMPLQEFEQSAQQYLRERNGGQPALNGWIVTRKFRHT